MSTGRTLMLSARLWVGASFLLATLAQQSWAQESIVLDGSSGMLPLARALATAYQKRNAEPRLQTGEGLGTGARLRALADGKIQIALASHGISAEALRKDNLKVIEVAKGAVVFAVNASVPLIDVTEAQACDLYSGRVRNWGPVSGADQPVAVLTRPPAEVDPEVIRDKIACFKDLKEVDTARVMPRGGDMASALRETAHAIGMTSMTVVEQSGGRVKALSLNGVAPTRENVKSGRYALSREFLFVVKAETSPDVKKFLDFVLSPDGDRVILENGAVPVR